ncbi:FecR family protein [Pedobacter nyackensis]|uniref:FecR family protein n=1 Tax=Pedobacter nyackensis TaxID=475255 RepID=A0A1W2ERZ7_9SPHI|nr:FecR family protein [Pedobacter nyackensis]SMD12425.1 FecR family protein [Pedobacter nyackensis]
MTEQERELLRKYNAGQCTEAESAAVEKWLFELNNEPVDLSAEKLAMIKAEIRNQLPEEIVITKTRLAYWPRIAAAVALIAFGTGLFYLMAIRQAERSNDLAQSVYANDVAPGRNSATLTLANGKKIVLSEAQNGELAKESGVVVSKTADGQIIYNVIPHASSGLTYNTLSTAKGETFQVRLPDGSLVVLNAASSLTYATTLNTLPERRVKLAGEAYFEVTKAMVKEQDDRLKVKRKPFIVVTDKQEVEVLGTHFNINSYLDEPGIKTTLLEGSVRVSNGSIEKLLKPGQQALAKQDGFLIREVNIQQAVAWKNGTFDFDNEDIQGVMRKISRWYNVEVTFEGEVSKERFNGALSRKKNISQMLKMLESTGVVHFKIEGRRVIVINN